MIATSGTASPVPGSNSQYRSGSRGLAEALCRPWRRIRIRPERSVVHTVDVRAFGRFSRPLSDSVRSICLGWLTRTSAHLTCFERPTAWKYACNEADSHAAAYCGRLAREAERLTESLNMLDSG